MTKAKRIEKDAKILKKFIKVYCHNIHSEYMKNENGYCKECFELLNFALLRNVKCQLDPKPKCKDCKIHCYKPEMRKKIKEVMKFSGIYFIKRGRVDWIIHYLL